MVARSDLGSQSQETRDAAAKTLLEIYTPPPRAQWEPLLATIKLGDGKEEILEKLRPFNPTEEAGARGGGSYCVSYRLDDLWSLRCCYRNSDMTLFKFDLIEFLRWVWVAPPPDFTGVWVTYFPNGQRSHEVHYREGRYFGEFNSYRSDGSKCVTQHYGADGVDGEDTGFFPSGRVAYRGYFKAGKKIGIWTWYNEDGSIRSTQDHTEP